MHKFYLTSECTPAILNLQDYTRLFENTLSAYNKLVQDSSLRIKSGVVTEKLSNALIVGSGFSLADVISSISDKPQRDLAYSYFIKYPIEDEILNLDAHYPKLQNTEYEITINGTMVKVFYMALVALDDGFGFTVPTHQDLKQNVLYFISKDAVASPNLLELWHLYEDSNANIAAIAGRIKDLNNASLDLFDRLMALLDNPVYHDRHFKKAFEDYSMPIQESILRKFEDAVAQDAVDNPNNNTVKEVKPSSKPKCTVLELRIFSPVAVRVYFSKIEGRVYLASVKLKDEKEQSRDIDHAHLLLVALVAQNTD